MVGIEILQFGIDEQKGEITEMLSNLLFIQKKT